MADENLSMDDAAKALDGMDLMGEGVEEESEQEEAETEETEEQEEAEGGEDAADDEDQDEDEAEEEDEDEEPDEEDSEDEPLEFEVTVDRDEDGNPVKGKVGVDELIAGWQRGRGYEAKMQETVEARKAAEQQREEIRKLEEDYKERLAQWAVPMEQEPDWQAAAQQLSPQEFNMARAQWEQRQRMSEMAKQEYQRIVAKQEEEAAQAAKQETIKAKDRLLNNVPEWRDGKKATAEIKEMADLAVNEYGITPEEVSSLTDDRQVRILRDAMLYRRLKENKATMEKRVSKPGKTLRPGSKTTAKQKSSQKQNQAMTRFKKTNSMDDAVEVMNGLLKDF